jgi:hypothetical protein
MMREEGNTHTHTRHQLNYLALDNYFSYSKDLRENNKNCSK